MKRWLQQISHSLSARLMLLFLLTGLLIAIILSNTIQLAMGGYFQRVIRPHLHLYLDYVSQDIGDPPSIENAQALTRRVPVDIYILGPEVNWSSAGWDIDLDEIDFHEHKRRSRGGKRLAFSDNDDHFILKTRAGDHTIYLAVKNRGRSWLMAIVGLIALAAMLLVLYLCYRAIHWLFQPVQTIRSSVRRIGQGELDHRISIRRHDELGELSTSINAMADDIEKMLDAKRQLLLAISHELRSPITRARVSTELLENSKAKQAISTDLKEMETMIAELLESERLNTRHQTLNKTPVAINQLVQEVIAEYFPGQKPIQQLSIEDPYLLLDAPRIKLLLKNLLENAFRHSANDVPKVTISTELKESQLLIEVTDNGPGIAAEHLSHLTEPFYRIDPSRQRKTGGFGLGLYLCRMIVEAHGGQLNIRSQLGKGTIICVQLSLAQP